MENNTKRSSRLKALSENPLEGLAVSFISPYCHSIGALRILALIGPFSGG